MTLLYIILAIYFWLMLIALAVTSPLWLSLFWVLLTGKSWNVGDSAGGGDVL